jgi:hypothetical protein
MNEAIEYENILFTYDLAAVVARLRQRAPENARRSKDIVDRGAAADALVRSLWSIEKEATKRLAIINDLTAALKRDKLGRAIRAISKLPARIRSKF